MMKRIIPIILLAVFSFTANAQSAESIITKVKRHYQSNQSFTADVVFEIDIPESQNQVMKGKLYLKNNQYKFVLPDQEIISDDITIWHWNKNDINEVQVSYVQNNEDVITPAKVFSDFLQGYSYKLDSTPTVNGKKLALIEITPESKNDYADIFKIKVVSDIASSSIKEMNIFTKDGVVYNFKVSNEKEEQLADSIFTFVPAKHPEVEVIDLR